MQRELEHEEPVEHQPITWHALLDLQSNLKRLKLTLFLRRCQLNPLGALCAAEGAAHSVAATLQRTLTQPGSPTAAAEAARHAW